MKKLFLGFGSAAFVVSAVFTQSVYAINYPTGVPRCQITDPNSGGLFFLSYPLPANHSTIVSEQIRKAPGAEDPTSLPTKEFKLAWESLVDRPNQQSKNDPLLASDGYTTELSSDASGSDGVDQIKNKSIPLAGSMQVNIKNDPIKYTITIKKDGSPVGNCSVSVKHNVGWIDVYKTPDTAQPTGNSLFPYKVKDILGTDYVNKPFPTPAEYSSPLKKFVGRYYDVGGSSGRFFDWGGLGYWPGFSGLEDNIGETANHLVMPMSASILGYKKSTLISRLESEPLLFFKGNTFRGKYADAFVPWDTVLQQDPSKSGMYLGYDEPCRLTVRGMDVDDRGYIYFSSANCFGGIIIARDNGSAIVPMLQILSPEDAKKASDNSKIKVKIVNGGTDVGNGTPKIYKSGTSYYLIQTEGKKTNTFNVTDPYNPTLHRSDSGSTTSGVQAGDVIAASNGVGAINIYSSSDFVNGLAPKKTFSAGESYKYTSGKFTLSRNTGQYKGLVGDKSTGTFFSIHYLSNKSTAGSPRATVLSASLSVFTPGTDGASSYSETKYPLDLSKFKGLTMSQYSNGYLIAKGNRDIKIWYFKNGKPVELDTKSFIKNYYGNADVSIHALNGKDYLFVNTSKLGDVYELEPISSSATTTTPTTTCAPGHLFNSVTGKPCSGGSTNTGCATGNLFNTATGLPCNSTQSTSKTPPVINATIDGPTSLSINQQGTWTAKATDPDKEDLSWSVDWGEGRSVLTCKVNPPVGTSQNWEYSASHSWTAAGNYTIMLYASDCNGGITQKSFTVVVK